MDAVPGGLVTVVVSQYPEILALAGEYGFAAIYNDAPEAGTQPQHPSGAYAVAGLRRRSFLSGRQPWLKRESAEALTALWAQKPSKIAAMAHSGVRGNPCLFPARLYPELFALTGDTGGSAVIRQHEDDLILLETDAWELTDVDTPAALELARRQK